MNKLIDHLLTQQRNAKDYIQACVEQGLYAKAGEWKAVYDYIERMLVYINTGAFNEDELEKVSQYEDKG